MPILGGRGETKYVPFVGEEGHGPYIKEHIPQPRRSKRCPSVKAWVRGRMCLLWSGRGSQNARNNFNLKLQIIPLAIKEVTPCQSPAKYA
jgi:hypothetical protein